MKFARLLIAAVITAVFLGGGIVLSATQATGASASVESAGNRMLDQAETRTGDWYAWGGAGPSVFDCSGLVYWAAGVSGESAWPRDTYEIAAQIGHRFVITSHPVRGDLAMWGPVSAPYHVEFVTIWADTTFGAQNSGTRVGWHYHYPGWRPDFYLHILW